MPLPPISVPNLARIDQGVAEVEARLRSLVKGVRAITDQDEIPEMTVYLCLVASLRGAGVTEADRRVIDLLLARAIMRLTETAYGR